jgi:(1->4)-alpha-D-glucan 1-alpha-D-glucosylmutase
VTDARVPSARPLRATYRLQLGPELTLDDAREYVPYLRELGVSHLYLSPVLQARRDSTHGYDGVDPTRISHDLGGERAFRELAAEAHEAGLGLILDVVPNHLAACDENPFWDDLGLRHRFFDLDPVGNRHRRFFDIDELAGVRVEDPEVFMGTHGLVLELVAEGLVDGLRVDHPDGLADPRGYLERLARYGVEHVWVEKILEPVEQLRDWPVEGTTGYEFLNDAQSLFVDPAGEEVLTELAGEPRSWSEIAFESKLEQARTTFEPEVAQLGRALDLAGIPEALASLPVYRTYVEPATGRVEDADREAAARLPDRLRRVLLLEERGHDEFVTRFQQTSGAVMAKGVEDTASYRYVRLLALNEVGGNPGRFCLGVDEFHAAGAIRAQRFPHNLLAATTHDTKRSADVRARIAALAGTAELWRERVLWWHELTAELRRPEAPDWNEELFVYQTLAGAWPIGPDRLAQYLRKALREAKRHTSWVEPDRTWEARVIRFALSLVEHEPFLADFEPLAAEIGLAGMRSALGQLVLRFTAPGVPDIYQGDELSFLALVDPDNRRPVNLFRRRRILARAGAASEPGTRKLWAIRELLALRARRPEAFEQAYEPLPAGPGTCAFRRGDDILVAVAFRGARPEVEHPGPGWRDVLNGLDAMPGGAPAVVYERLPVRRPARVESPA